MKQINLDLLISHPLMKKLLILVLGLIFLGMIIRYSQAMFGKYIRETSARYRARKFILFVGYISGFLFIIGIFSDRLAGFHMAIGMAGAGIAFSLQEIIASVAGWFAISFGGYYKTGDRVQLGGIKGDVIDIGILRTTIMEIGEWLSGDAYNGRVVRVAFVFKETVFNYPGDFPFLWDEITILVKFGGHIIKARNIFKKVADDVIGEYTKYARETWNEMVRKYLIENADVEPMIFLSYDVN